MKKGFILFFLILQILLVNFTVFSLDSLKELNLYYSDLNGNNKIDNLEIEFNKTLTGNINFNKLFLYSNTGGLSTSKLDSVSGDSIFSGFYLSGNILGINLIEQDNFLTGLVINNTTSSHLRLKTNAGVGIFDEDGNEIKLLYTSSFNNYKNVFYRELIDNNFLEETTQSGNSNETNFSILTSSGELENNTGSSTNTGMIDTSSETIIQSGSLEENTSLTLTQSGIIENVKKSFSGKIIFQNPTYLSGKELELNEYNCLDSEVDCKVNFNLNIDFGSGFTAVPTSKYNCEWDFGIDDFVEEKYKCNPNTIIYPKGTYNVNYKIWEISNPSNFFSKSFKIVNNGYVKPISEVKTVYVLEKVTNDTLNNYYIETPKIIVQSGLDENNNCKKEDCIVNVKYNVKTSREACLWDFGGGSFNIGDDNKCNPGYIKYSLGDFKITLKVYEVGNLSNYKESSIFFRNQKKIEKESKKETDEENKDVLSLTGQIFTGYTLKISKVLPNPVGSDDIEFIELENFGTGELNLKGCRLDDKRGSASKPFKINEDKILPPESKIKFFKFETGINLNNNGDEVNLVCNNNLIDSLVWNFSVPEGVLLDSEIVKMDLDEIKKQNNTEKISLSDFLQAEIDYNRLSGIINKNFTQKIKIQKSGVKIYGKTFPNTRVIIKLDKIEEFSLFFKKAYASEDNIYETVSDEKGDYQIILQNLNIGQFEIKTTLSDGKDNYFEIDKKLSFKVDTDYLDYVNFSKEKEKLKKENKTSKKEEIAENLKARIVLQRLAKGIGVSGNKIICQNMDECSINFDGRKSSGKIKSYNWDFGNGTYSNKPNPKAVKYTTGKYIVSLSVSDLEDESSSYFFVEVEGKDKKEKKVIKNENKNLSSKVSKIDIIPTVLASNDKNEDFVFHLFMTTLTFLLFLLMSFVILKKEKII